MGDARRTDCDVLIVGGGLVGSLLANALTRLPLEVALVEARSADARAEPHFDGRATALANGSQRIIAALGLWDAIRAEAQPIERIHIGERGRFGAARISAREEGVPALGFTVENRVLGSAFWEPLARNGKLDCYSPAVVTALGRGDEAVEATVESEGASTQLRARLVVAADGADSRIRAALGIEARVDDYDQQAIVVNGTTAEPHRGRAFERFTADGPLAVLPLTRERVAVVFTLATDDANEALALSNDAFRDVLQRAFGYRLGAFERIGRRDGHPLRRVRSRAVTTARTVLIGNAAIALHPVAGQGFNLALRDAAALAEVIADAVAAGQADAGDAVLLDRYRRWRADDQRRLAGFTHALVRGFGTRAPGLSVLRGLGLMAFDLAPGAKSLLARHTMGLAGRAPKLARHLDIV